MNRRVVDLLMTLFIAFTMTCSYWVFYALSIEDKSNSLHVEGATLPSTSIDVDDEISSMQDSEDKDIVHTFIFDNSISTYFNELDYETRPLVMNTFIANCRYTFSNGFYIRDTFNFKLFSSSNSKITYKSVCGSLTVNIYECDYMKTDVTKLVEEYISEHDEDELYCSENIKLNYGISKFIQYYDLETMTYYSVCYIKCTESGRILCIEVTDARDVEYPLASTIEVARDGVRLFK